MGGATATGGASGGGCSGACVSAPLVSTGFEDASGGLFESTNPNSPGAIELVASPAHSGGTALHATQNSPQSGTGLRFNFSPVESGTLYFRGWIYLPTQNLFAGLNIVEFVTATSEWIDINIENPRNLNLYFPSATINQDSQTGVVPFDKWFCLQVKVAVSDAGGSIALSMNDGPSLVTVTNRDTLPTSGISAITVGLPWTYPNELDSSIYFDDILVSTSPISCN